MINNNKIVEIDGKANEIIKSLFKSKKSKNYKFKNLIYIPNIKAKKKLIFLISNIKKAFNYLKYIFIKTLILQHFNFK